MTPSTTHAPSPSPSLKMSTETTRYTADDIEVDGAWVVEGVISHWSLVIRKAS